MPISLLLLGYIDTGGFGLHVGCTFYIVYIILQICYHVNSFNWFKLKCIIEWQYSFFKFEQKSDDKAEKTCYAYISPTT